MPILDLFKSKKKGMTFGTETASLSMFSSFLKNGVSYSATQFYFKSIYVNKALEKRAQKTSQINFVLKKNDDVIEDDDLLDILAKPNEMMTGEQFFYLWTLYKDIYGEVYVLISKDKQFMGKTRLTLDLLLPSKVSPTFDDFGNLKSVVFNGNTYYSDELIYDYRPNPVDPKRGISLLLAGKDVVSSQIGLDELNAKLIASGGKLDGIFSFNQENLLPEQLEEYKDHYRKELDERSEMGNVIFMGSGAKYQKVNLSPEELGYSNSKKIALNDICILTDVPKFLLNSTDDIKFDNANASLRMFIQETIYPMQRQIAAAINEKIELIPEEYELTVADPTPADPDQKLKLIESGSKNMFMTVNEMREIAGMEPIDGGDTIRVPMAYQDYSDVEDNTTEEPEEKPDDQKQKGMHPLKSFEFRRAYFAKRIATEDRFEKMFIKALRKYLKEQKERLLLSLGQSKRQKDIVSYIFDEKLEINMGKRALMPILTEFAKKIGAEAIEMVGGTQDFLFNSDIQRRLDTRANFFLSSISETTFEQLKNVFTENRDEGGNRQDLIDKIQNVYEGISEGRAKTIARTEVHYSVQDATMEGYKQAGMNIKIWVAVLDDKTRDSHAEMDGEERPIDMPFSNGLMFPGDSAGDASETINCRCQI